MFDPYVCRSSQNKWGVFVAGFICFEGANERKHLWMRSINWSQPTDLFGGDPHEVDREKKKKDM